ncbi:NDMA-dependent alcohol dehydrogenase [Mycobacterium nebraskense]|uniref:alcohol dehydrogenase n=1 Tax=Mycobacterium nebraskense TaxID=244292 RepID=A0A0F5NGN0_9MYCO|nr:NDMA-dependent alcohol dehydrogenase [Mycobacterium nebraskense]KKC06204.1 alcohol dehydrogenase [Mycobacterium nebraskense]KLO34763.1 alcohol dehydrogenase [Mycobacterium nebraskense]MBI2695988.1 NDMA-dependent alcohol dehydrogenase [Mycobacterium nebraskense]MCV7116409.1 NDMA-dependent alcohol dehydrogenase [Mycobacterium nebraskense]ORW34809.1 alcohol dehydrogenase [Mycobacterium nebraskense]
MKTKGALVWELNQPWSVEEIEIGAPRHGEVTVQLETAGLCHSDHHLMTGDFPIPSYPVLGGHEGAGIVTEVGESVENLAVGDHVVMSFIPSCGKCTPCQVGLRNLCDLGMGLLSGASVSDGSFRVTAKGRDVIPMSLLGTFAPYVVVHQTSVVKVDPGIPFDVACLVGCGVTTGYGSAVRSAAVEPGDDVAVIGVGGVGIAAIQGARLAGARRIFAVDPFASQRKRALKFGATEAFADVPSAAGAIAEATWGTMCRKVIVTVGHCDGGEVEAWLGLTAKGGTCVLTAMGNVMATDVTLNLAGLTLLQKSLQGSLFGGGNPQHDIPAILELYKLGQLNLDDMVTREYTLEQINDGYRDMLEGRNVRGIIRYTDADRA